MCLYLVLLMDARTLLGLEKSGQTLHWTMEVQPALCNFSGVLFGGAALGAGIEVLETATKRPVIWATAQYLQFAPMGSRLDLEVVVPVNGNSTTQARVIGRVGDTEVFTVSGAFGERDVTGEGRFADRPLVRRPADSPERTFRQSIENSINEHLEMRIAKGRSWDELDGTPSPDGRCALWARMPGIDEMSASSLAILGDWVPFGVGQALGMRAGGNSLDNTLRFVQSVPTDWVLLDIRVHSVHNGYAHGLVHQWAEDGTLLATAAQTVMVRHWDEKIGHTR
jgi:acyl-CoA thioesterase II